MISPLWPTVILFGAIAVGSVIGVISGSTGAALGKSVDSTVLLLIFLLFFESRVRRFTFERGDLRFIALAWCANFLIVPTIGFLVASVFLAGKPLFFTGVMIYFMAPCTDWFLGFTRLAGGNVRLGSLLVPINMTTQLMLYPAYLILFTQWESGFDIAIAGEPLLEWFVIPFVGARALHLVLSRSLPGHLFDRTLDAVARILPLVIASLVAQIFAANITVIADHLPVFALILPTVLVFFIGTWIMGDALSRRFNLTYPDRALLTMTTAARNAPLMLGVTVAAIPHEPLIHAAIIIGMLVEFPHLAMLTHLLNHQRARHAAHPAPASPLGRHPEPGLGLAAVRDV